MGKKKAEDAGGKMIGLRVNPQLWERFQTLASSTIPRVSATALLEAAIIEYLDRHEPKTKKEGKR